MELTVLGCQGGVPAGGRASSGYLVDSGPTRLLLDCGPGIATALSAHGGADTLDAIVLSHLHIDHCFDLQPIGTSRLRAPGATPLPLFGPVGTAALLHRLSEVFPIVPDGSARPPFLDAFSVMEYQPRDVIDVGDCTVELVGLRHIIDNCGARVRSGEALLAYTGDTGPTEALHDLATGADLLLSQGGEFSDTEWGQLGATDAATVAASAGVGTLVLTHLRNPDPTWAQDRLAEARDAFAGPVHLASPGEQYIVR
jgi:ribonuclease BN (tRNA processing enzyme)